MVQAKIPTYWKCQVKKKFDTIMKPWFEKKFPLSRKETLIQELEKTRKFNRMSKDTQTKKKLTKCINEILKKTIKQSFLKISKKQSFLCKKYHNK